MRAEILTTVDQNSCLIDLTSEHYVGAPLDLGFRLLLRIGSRRTCGALVELALSASMPAGSAGSAGLQLLSLNLPFPFSAPERVLA